MPSEYLTKLKAILQSINKPTEQLSKNRARFENIHANERYNGLGCIFQRLQENDDTLNDTEIIEDYLKFSDSIQTNTFAAAELEWVTVATICSYKPHLAPLLIRRGLHCIIYSFGNDIDASVVFTFIKQRILGREVEPYGGLPNQAGVTWLRELLTQPILVQQILDEVIEQNKQELNEM